jgi:hypothetical protein
MTRRTRAEKVIYAFSQGIQYGEDWDERNVANALREAVDGLNIEPNPDVELSIEKHHFIRGQLWVKSAIIHLAEELDKIAQEAEEQ